MSRTRARTGNSSSVFPFLAVMVCAMGALIFLLLIMTQRIRSDAVEAAFQKQIAARNASVQTEPSPEPETVPVPVVAEEPLPGPEFPTIDRAEEIRREADRKQQEEEWERKRLARIAANRLARQEFERDQAAQEIERARLERHWRTRVSELKHELEQHKRRLRDANVELASAATDARSKDSSVKQLALKRDELKSQLSGLRAKLDRLSENVESLQDETRNYRKRIETEEQKLASRPSEFTFIPFEGTDGTTRRPIFIECTGRQIRFLAEGIELTPAQLNGFSAHYNPLLAGAEALVDHWNAQGTGDAHKPYVLLIVRPEGSVAFYVARQLLERLKVPFGYELVDSDFRLSIKESEPTAQRVCRAAVNHVLAQQPAIAHRATGRFLGGESRVRLQGDRKEFTFVDQDGDKPSGHGGVTASDGLIGRKTNAADHFFRSEGFATRKQSGTKGDAPPERADSRTVAKSGTTPARQITDGGPSFDVTAGSPLVSDDSQTPATENASQSTAGSATLGSPDRAGRARLANPADKFLAATDQKKNERTANGSSDTQTGAAATPTPADAGTTSSNAPQETGTTSPAKKADPRPINLANRRWGKSEPGATIGWENDVEIKVFDGHLVIADSTVVQTGNGIPRDQLVQRVIDGLDRHVHTWGKAPRQFYWIPALTFTIYPQSETTYEAVGPKLREMGLPVTVRHSLAATRSATRPGDNR